MSVNRYTIARYDGWRGVKPFADGEICWWSDLKPQIDRLTRELAEARKTLQFVERWANHHGVKPHVTPAEALGVIQHHPDILEITDSYVDGKRPTTRNPYAELAEAKARAAARIAELEALVELYRRQGADQDARAWIAMSAECEARGQEIDRLRAEVEEKGEG